MKRHVSRCPILTKAVNQMTNEEVNYCNKNLQSLLTTNVKLDFIFHTGQYRQISLKGHQLPLKNSFLSEHARALRSVRFMWHKQNDEYYLLVSASFRGNLERQEYLVKRAILDLSERYGWEVKT